MTDDRIVEVWWDDTRVGRLSLTDNGLCAFSYDAQYLISGVSISPFELPLKKEVFVADYRPFDGGFGVFDDSLPDGWGALVFKRYLRKHGIDFGSLSILDRLTWVGNQGRGALEFRPAVERVAQVPSPDLTDLALEAQKILTDANYDGIGLEEFQRRGGSSGGARPKIFVNCGKDQWLVKFAAQNDPENVGRIEYQYSLLAKECGIEMPETRLFEEKFFGVRRFDRTETGKFHVVSMAGLVCADYRAPSIDYQHILQVCAALTHSQKEIQKVFRLMVFNWLIGNKDDHVRNFSFIYRDASWHFAPAYDLLPSEGFAGFHTTSINGNNAPDESDLLAVAQHSGMDLREAKKELQRIRDIVVSSPLYSA